jgi:transposase
MAVLNDVARATSRLETAEQERRRAIIAAWTAGASVRQLAAAAGVSKSAMARFLADAALAWKNPLPADVDGRGDLAS